MKSFLAIIIEAKINNYFQTDRMWVGQRSAASSAEYESDNKLLLSKSASNSSSIGVKNGSTMESR